MAQNIKLRKRNFTTDQGYFYTMEEDRDNLLQKTDDGNTCFSYPLDTLISKEILSLEFDGVNFWSLEQANTNEVKIRRWQIDNYVCKLRQVIDLTADSEHYYNSQAFSVEHYHDTLTSGIVEGGNVVPLAVYGEDEELMNFTTTSGLPLKLHLGPNDNGEEEDVYIQSVVGDGSVVVTPATMYGYAEGDPVNFYTYLWLFNNNNGQSADTGALYKIDPYNGDYIKRYPGGAYKDISAATFYKVNSFAIHGVVDSLAFVKSTNTLFVNVREETPQGELEYYGSMVMSNILNDEYTTIPVYDLAMDGQNVYRLQKGEDGSSSVSGWPAYSYELSSLDSFVTSISLAAYPAIIAANGVNSTDIKALVKDQFLQPIIGRLVYFTEDDPVGSITGGTPINTNSQGLAQTVYRSGTAAREVKITATVEQT